MKKFFLFMAMVAFFAACNTPATSDSATADENIMTVDELLDNIDNLIDSSVVFTGEVDHVCKHGGTKMVVFNPETDNSIHVDAGASGNFRADEVANQNVIVWGKVVEMRVDEAYIDNLQAELDEFIATGGDEDDMAEKMDEAKDGKKLDADRAPEMDNKHKQEIDQRVEQIKNLRDKLTALQAEGKNHISYFSVDCDKYEVKVDENTSTTEKSADKVKCEEEEVK